MQISNLETEFMNIEIVNSTDKLIVRLVGRLNEHDATTFTERFIQETKDHLAPIIEIDLCACESLGTLGFGALVSVRLSESYFSREVFLVGANVELSEQIKILKLHQIFQGL